MTRHIHIHLDHCGDPAAHLDSNREAQKERLLASIERAKTKADMMAAEGEAQEAGLHVEREVIEKLAAGWRRVRSAASRDEALV